MPRMEIKKLLLTHSDRVKSVDLHPTEPWVLSSLYNGKVVVRNFENQQVLKSFDATELPVRAVKFIPRKRWIVCGADDMKIRVYNYNTSEKEKEFEAHTDYIRSIAVHSSLPYILTSSDDLTIKLWNWEKNWQNVRTFEGHSHYVMQLVFSSKDPNVFASCSLDTSIRVWNINSPVPNFTLDGHTKGVNCIDFYHGGDKPHMVSGSDDTTVKVWDYQTKSCIQTLEGHSHNVTVVCFHPKLPLIISGSEDHIVNIWNGNTYKLVETINYGLDRCWALSYSTLDTKVALGYDNGTVVLKMGREEPVVAMDRKGKVLIANNNELSQITIKALPDGVAGGEKVNFPHKELTTCDIYPEKIEFDQKGKFVAICGDGECAILSAISFKNQTFCTGEDLAWGPGSGMYATREKSGSIKLYNSFKQVKSYKKSFFTPQQIFGGHLLGIRSNDFICLYDWETFSLVRSIEVVPQKIYWNENGDYVAICCENSFYILRYNSVVVRQNLKGISLSQSDTLPHEGDGVPDCLELEEEIGEQVREGQWIGDCFIYISNANRLSYFIGGQSTTVAHLDKSYYLLGYISKYNRVYLIDQDKNIISYQLHISVIQYETAIVRGDLEDASSIFSSVPPEFHNQLARFLDSQGHRELALQVSKDPEHQFELAVSLAKLQQALDILQQQKGTQFQDQKWRQLGSIALHQADFSLAEECMWKGKDYPGLLLLFTSTSDIRGLSKLAEESLSAGKMNVSFTAYFYLQDLKKCIDILVDSGRITEAAFFARTYMPSEVSRIVKLWKEDVKKVNEKAAESLADPEQYPNLFPDFDLALESEKKLSKFREQRMESSRYLEFKGATLNTILEKLKNPPQNGHTNEEKQEEKQEENDIINGDEENFKEGEDKIQNEEQKPNENQEATEKEPEEENKEVEDESPKKKKGKKKKNKNN